MRGARHESELQINETRKQLYTYNMVYICIFTHISNNTSTIYTFYELSLSGLRLVSVGRLRRRRHHNRYYARSYRLR